MRHLVGERKDRYVELLFRGGKQKPFVIEPIYSLPDEKYPRLDAYVANLPAKTVS